MTLAFNTIKLMERRRDLRANMPRAEAIMWNVLKSRQLVGCKFRRQYSVGPYVVDFYTTEVRIAIELDGESHFEPGQYERDQERDSYLESFGIRVVRIMNDEVFENIDNVLAMIA